MKKEQQGAIDFRISVSLAVIVTMVTTFFSCESSGRKISPGSSGDIFSTKEN
ncbi:MAG: hypothetical protein M1469_05390 [Bacteroidetes bacterium]|nr:hypothetical protein [Bacteroidota bacterium]